MLDDVEPTPGPTIVVRPSVAVELGWALAAAERRDFHPLVTALYEDVPELRQRVATFWDDHDATRSGGFFELLALANHGGLLFSTDGALLLHRLDELGATSPADLRLASETDADRAAILARMAELRSSVQRRGDYVQLMTEVWAALRGTWERDGRRRVEAAVASRRELLAKGMTWPDVVRSDCDYEGLPQLVDALGDNDLLAVVPAFFAHRGLVLDLPGVLVVGVRADQSGALSRARTEVLARRLKSISDPTRLAILDSLSRGSATVSEIAASFALAQPTVSNHVKLLRDAGLIANAPGHGGGRRELVLQPEAVADLLDQLQWLLRPPSEPAEAVPGGD